MSNFYKAIPFILKHEGKLSMDKDDSGNWTSGKIGVGQLKGTKYGISASSYPDLDIQALTEDEAIEIYRKGYWRSYMDMMPFPIAAKLFDCSVNMGCKWAAILLQRAAGVIDDGHIGHDTLMAINKDDVDLLLRRYISAIKRYYDKVIEAHPEKEKYHKGWIARAESRIDV